MFPSCILALSVLLGTSDWPLTTAEETQFKKTSSYADVMRFLASLQKQGAPIHVQTIGVTANGKKMPLVIASRPLVTTPHEARRSGKPVVYLQANIHAGEVEGKEAVLMLLRDLSRTDPQKLLEKLVLVVTPIYNADGNDNWGSLQRNRPSQDGPDPVGERASGQGYDLNRDCIKAESLEMRAVLEHVYHKWDPEVVMDLHTTNGTRHNFLLTYSPPLNPNTESGILRYSRDELLPHLRKSLKALNLFDYGNAEGRGETRAWRTFGQEGRYVTNYAGLRNRIAVLSEAASFLPFQTRIDATYKFVLGVLQKTASDAKRILTMTRDADTRVADWGRNPEKAPPLGVRFEMAQRGTETVELEKLAPGEQPNHGKAPKNFEPVKMPIYDRFVSTKTSKYPSAYLFPKNETRLTELLRRHGIVVETLDDELLAAFDVFTIRERVQSQQAFQGHRLIRLEGTFTRKRVGFDSGSFVVRMSQPLGVLAFHILEPESLDGAAAWEFLDSPLIPQADYPIVKTYTPLAVATTSIR